MRWRGPAGKLVALALLMLAAGIAAAAGQQPPLVAARSPLGHDLPRLRTWLDAVERHLPGQKDRPAVEVGSWTIPQLETTFFDFTALVQIAERPAAKPKFPAMVRSMTPLELAELRQLAAADARTNLDPNHPASPAAASRTINRVVKRAALLHTDIAALVDSSADQLAASTPALVLKPRLTLRLADARQVGVDYYGSHWDLARLLLDQVRPTPATDLAVRDWYRAVAAVFASGSQRAESFEHLERAGSLFPDDAEIARAAGLLHEAEAAPSIQRFVETMPPDNPLRAFIGTARSNLRQAQSFHRKAVALDPDSAEAHLHLGRVTGLLGRHDEAARALRRASAAARDPRTSYYASLFLGVEEDALGHSDAARAAFERAAELCPRAQSPYLALSQLARRRGDRIAARRFIEEVWSRSNDDRLHEDPWTTYLTGTAAQSDARLADARTALFPGAER